MLAAARRTGLLLLCLLLSGGLASAPAAGQEPAAEPARLSGRVTDAATGAPLAGVTVRARGPAEVPGESVRVTDADGAIEFPELPAGRYRIRFVQAGYEEAALEDFALAAGPNRADRALAPLAAAAPEAAPDVEEFVVIASPVAEILAASRFESDQLLNTLSAEDFSKLAVSDVADALKFVPGVNVVEGQFAVIRGLEDRYSSTLFNGAVVPSPDPDRQSVQLDLFPADVVSDLAVSKTFAPELPSNSSGGSINILTQSYPEKLEFKLSAGTGFNDRAWGSFLDYNGSAVGDETGHGDVLEGDFAASVGGRGSFLERELRFKAALGWESDYETQEGYQETREPRASVTRRNQVIQSGDLSLGELSLSGGRFDLENSESEERRVGYAGFGFDLDEAGNHRIDSSVFYSHKEDETVQLKDDGFIPYFDYGALAERQAQGQEVTTQDFDCCTTLTTWLRSVRGSTNDAPSRGPLWFTSFQESESFERERDLTVYQLNGDHTFDQLEGLHASWAGNYATTTQDEKSQGLRYFFEPADTGQLPTGFPSTPQALGPGDYATNGGIFASRNEISEHQGFGRLDLDYEIPVHEDVVLKLTTGGWYEDASRDVDSSFLESPTVGGASQLQILGPDPLTLGKSIDETLDPDAGIRETTNESSREIQAWHLGGKATLYEQVDVLAGFRLESIFIESLNDAFTGEDSPFGGPETFPSRYLFFDRLDNPARGEVVAPPPDGTTYNDQVLGIDVPVDPATGLVDLVDAAEIESLVNGRIDETHLLPAFGLAWRPIDGLALRGAFSETVARPSFREMGFYVSVEPASDDLIVGNPQLGLSDVESWDLRTEYTWGDVGDLAALSLFYKTIQDPIESIVVRNPLNLEGSSSALYRTFFNNENEATLRGIELEARKNLGFLYPDLDLLQYLSLGGNFTYIDAEVDRSEIEIARSEGFFGTAIGDPDRFTALEGSRRLFGQPEWIANADLTFDNPDWGTRATLVLFGISDVLDAAGSAVIAPNGEIISFTPDRYIDSFYQLDLILSKKWRVDVLRGDLTFKVSIKNLTDSTRRIIYDTEQTRNEIAERSYKVGRDFSFSLTYEF
jgi:outer membrane receptor protein involved in Fe transport